MPCRCRYSQMLLQTLLENAQARRVAGARAGRIGVIVRTTADQVRLEVRNTGPAENARALPVREGEGFGLHSVRERLKGHFGDRASFTLVRDETEQVTVATIAMPTARIAA